MRVYFLSEKTGGLFLGGLYLGLVDGFERSVELDPADGIFCEVKPFGGFLPFSFCLDEAFLRDPPPQASLYFTEQGVAVCLSGFLHADQSMHVLSQTRIGGSLLTLVRQGKLQLNLENETGFHMLELDDRLEACTPRPLRGGFLLKGENVFAQISHGGELLLFSEGTLLSEEEPLEAEVPFHDSRGHTARMKWQNGKLLSCSVLTRGEPAEATFALALFESVLLGTDARPFLTDDLAAKAERLKEFLGGFTSVALTEERDKIGLVYPRKPRVFDVRYFRVSLSENKISNIVPL